MSVDFPKFSTFNFIKHGLKCTPLILFYGKSDFELWISSSDSELLGLNTHSNEWHEKVTPYFDLILFAHFADLLLILFY